MKRLFCLLLCLLCLSTAAFAEAVDAATTYDFGDFTIDAPAGAFVQQMEKEENAAFFAVLPNYDASQLFHDSYSVAWMRDDLSASFFLTDATALTQTLLDLNTGRSPATGVEISNARLIDAAYGENGDRFYYCAAMDVDHAGAGVDLQYTAYYAQAYMDLGDEAGYIFSFSARDAEGLEALIASANIAPRV